MIITRPLPYIADSSLYFERIRDMGQAVYLDSGQAGKMAGRFDIISAAPVETLTFNEASQGKPFDKLAALYQRYSIATSVRDDLPFQGGAIGYFGYDLARAIEKLPSKAKPTSALPDMCFGIYLWAIVVDHKLKQCQLVATPTVTNEQLEVIEAKLSSTDSQQKEPFSLKARFSANMSKHSYIERLQQVDDYIHAGDCYQINFTQRFQSQFSGDSWHAYKALRHAAPTPYSAYIDGDDFQILSLSPEQFLAVKEGQVTTKPIKGTRPRSSEPSEDLALKAELVDSEKDRAENLMIVDLLRNDLSKVCAHQSVKVPKLFNIESYANVHHKVSTVTGTLADDQSPISLLEHCFPGGSITGAPKIRAMEIIEELEPHRRSIYCGSIGYISFCGRMDTSITIRTLLCDHNDMYVWAGGGIVADSDPELEYEECFSKINNLLNCLESTFLASTSLNTSKETP